MTIKVCCILKWSEKEKYPHSIVIDNISSEKNALEKVLSFIKIGKRNSLPIITDIKTKIIDR